MQLCLVESVFIHTDTLLHLTSICLQVALTKGGGKGELREGGVGCHRTDAGALDSSCFREAVVENLTKGLSVEVKG